MIVHGYTVQEKTIHATWVFFRTRSTFTVHDVEGFFLREGISPRATRHSLTIAERVLRRWSQSALIHYVRRSKWWRVLTRVPQSPKAAFQILPSLKYRRVDGELPKNALKRLEEIQEEMWRLHEGHCWESMEGYDYFQLFEDRACLFCALTYQGEHAMKKPDLVPVGRACCE